MSHRIPATVLAGYLGSGKTTAINHLLKHAGGRRLAVLVNDFGAINIDIDLIQNADDKTISLTNGCVCCSIADDLGAALDTQRRRADPPDHIVIEASGVSEPTRIAHHVAGWPGITLNGVWSMADVETVQSRARDKFVGGLVSRQLTAADLVFINKTDLVAAGVVADLRRWLKEHTHTQRIEETSFGAIDPSLLDLPPFPQKARSLEDNSTRTSHHGALEATIWFPAGTVDIEALRRALINASEALHRAKGFVKDNSGCMMLIQFTGQRFEMIPAENPRNGGRLALIGRFLDGDIARLTAQLDQCVMQIPDER